MTPQALLTEIDRYADIGACREIDRAFVRLLFTHVPEADAAALIGALLASAQLARGHICVDLAVALANPRALLPALSAPIEELLAGMTVPGWTNSLCGALADTDAGSRPLVVDNGRLYLRRYWQYETLVADALSERALQSHTVPADLRERLDRFFEPYRDEAERDHSSVHWQTVAAATAAASGLVVVSGGPGTGKTTAVVRLLAVLQELALEQGRPLAIRLAAPTGKAAARLGESIASAAAELPSSAAAALPQEVTTVHRLLGSRPGSRAFRYGRANPLPADLLVIDEASMVDLELMAAVVSALRPDARLILLGDRDQLASVEAGAVLAELCEAADAGYSPTAAARIEAQTGYRVPVAAAAGALADQVVVLRRSHRFEADSGIARLAEAINSGDSVAALAALDDGGADVGHVATPVDGSGAVARCAVDGMPSSAGYREFFQSMQAVGGQIDDAAALALLERFNRVRVLCALRSGPFGVEALNAAIAAELFDAGLIDTPTGWYAGRPVMVTRNDYSLGLMNGDVGITVRNGDGALRVLFQAAGADGLEVRRIPPSRLTAVETVYAMTVHKSQGSEFDHTLLVLPPVDSPGVTRELLYTAVTRARRRFSLVAARMSVFESGIGRRTLRASGLAAVLARRLPPQID